MIYMRFAEADQRPEYHRISRQISKAERLRVLCDPMVMGGSADKSWDGVILADCIVEHYEAAPPRA